MKNNFLYNLQREADDYGAPGNWYPQYRDEKRKNEELQNQLTLQKELIEEARLREIRAFYWGQDSVYFEFLDYENSENYNTDK